MQAVTIDDGTIRVADRPDPAPGPDELLVRVAGAGLNGADLLQRAGHYPAPAGIPDDQPGLEFAGTVTAVGDRVVDHAPGDRVMGIVGGAAQAELVTTPADLVLGVPDGWDLVHAGGAPEALITAHDALFTQGRLGPGDRLLVTGAAGGVGTAAIQLAVATGAEVVASARGEDRHDALRSLGAAEVVLPDDQAAAGPFDVVLELVGAPSVATLLRSLATGARIVVIGVGAGSRLELDLLALMGARATLRGSTLRARPLADRVTATRSAGHVLGTLAARDAYTVPVAAIHDLGDAATAYDDFDRGGHLGKVILAP
ncbi:zinc-binding dehydrogenase [Salsipaludibacter albus]|uniref:zinc-binding dehydrogenase n=1 Tax=Salsipaludibacter albus TaxID=2849650 RepID=UPI001EE49FCF|nr:zinc-binding dehydrogenase [Salsipaludibacter albus]MBY5161635.1 zinc-binding dehydrogenase [Salsipaludibacter albus]